MRAVDLLHEGASSAAARVRRPVALREVSAVQHLPPQNQPEISHGVHRPAVAAEVEAGLADVRVMALHASAVEDGLHVAREVRHVEKAPFRINLARPTRKRLRHGLHAAHGIRRLALMAPHASLALAGHHLREALHSLHSAAIGVNRHEEERLERGRLEVGAAVRFHRHPSKKTRQRERAAERERLHAAREVDRLGQHLEHHQPLYRAGLHALHAATLEHVLEVELARLAGEVRAVGENPLARVRHKRTRLVKHHAQPRAPVLRREAAKKLALSCAVAEKHILPVGKHEEVRPERPWVEEIPLRDGLYVGAVVGSALGGEHAYYAAMVAPSVSGRVYEHNVLRAGYGLGVDIDAAGVGVPLVDLVLGAVGVHCPEMMERHLAAVNILPAHVEDASVGKHPRCVVVFWIRGDHAHPRTVRLHAIDGSHLRDPAVHPAPAAGGDEHDVAIGKPGGLDVVIAARGEPLQPRAVGVDGVKVEMLLAGRPVGEENRLAVVVDARVAHAPGRIGKNHAVRTGLDVVGNEAPAAAVCRRFRRSAEIREVGVPVGIFAHGASGEHDLVERTAFT